MAYIQDLHARGESARVGESAGAENAESNFLAQYWAAPQRDREQYVVHRDNQGMVLLNRFPYANGHLLVALGEPRATLAEYNAAQRAHFWKLMDLAMELCQAACQPQGMNVGLNVGRAAGAGLPQHIHGHVVPRWMGDSNFMSVMGEVRIVPDALDRTWERYRSVLQSVLTRTL